jgi:hypothetical protein
MEKTELLHIISKLLAPESCDLDFLLELKKEDLMVLTGCIRERVEDTEEGG